MASRTVASETGSTARCPHCGRRDAPVEGGIIERHRRVDLAARGRRNEICLGELTLVGYACEHMIELPTCWTQRQRALAAEAGGEIFSPGPVSG